MTDFARLASEIAANGTRAAFGITGSGPTLSLLDQLEQKGVEPVRTHFEGSAALMAATTGRISGKAGVAYSIKGPGFANMMSGIAAAHFETYPLVALIEAYPPGSDADRAHKRLDQAALASSVTKGLAQNGPGSGFSAAAALAESEVPGPTVLELVSSSGSGFSTLIEDHHPGMPEDLMRILERANRPVVIAGTLAVRAGWGAFLKRLSVPVFSTASAKGVVDERSSISAGVYTGVGLELAPETSILAAADLVIGLGLRPVEVLQTKPFQCKAVNIDPAKISGVGSFFFEAAASAIPNGFWDLLATKNWGADLLQSSIERMSGALTSGFLPAAVFEAIQSRLPRSTRVVFDTGYFCTIAEHVWRSPAADLCLMAGNSKYMGTSIPMAVGAAIHDPGVPTIVFAGDGGIGMYVAELRLAAERQLPFLAVLLSDGRYSSISTRAITDQLTQTPLTIRHPGWMGVMEGMRLQSRRATSLADVDGALADWLKNPRPTYLEIAFDPTDYEAMCRRLR